MDKWLPMETAPKDGSYIILGSTYMVEPSGRKNFRIFRVKWQTGPFNPNGTWYTESGYLTKDTVEKSFGWIPCPERVAVENPTNVTTITDPNEPVSNNVLRNVVDAPAQESSPEAVEAMKLYKQVVDKKPRKFKVGDFIIHRESDWEGIILRVDENKENNSYFCYLFCDSSLHWVSEQSLIIIKKARKDKKVKSGTKITGKFLRKELYKLLEEKSWGLFDPFLLKDLTLDDMEEYDVIVSKGLAEVFKTIAKKVNEKLTKDK